MTSSNTHDNTAAPAATLGEQQRALLSAVDALLAPLADLCLAKGLTIQSLEEHLRAAMVQSALNAHLGGNKTGQLSRLKRRASSSKPMRDPSASESAAGNQDLNAPQINREDLNTRLTSREDLSARLTSRVSASTGLSRREVARLLAKKAQADSPVARPSSATEVFTRWATSPALRDAAGQVLVLPRTGPAPSFEQLAQSVTQDVHPRSLLDELCRLGVARWNTDLDTVQLERSAFVPSGDWARMTAFLGDNVGDHLRAATANVLGDGQQHLEQAIFADELSTESLQKFRAVMGQQWQALLQSLTPQLEQLIADDAREGRSADQRLRVGLYTWSQDMPPIPDTGNHANNSLIKGDF
jgi:Family of unknown function (DUF6502)